MQLYAGQAHDESTPRTTRFFAGVMKEPGLRILDAPLRAE